MLDLTACDPKSWLPRLRANAELQIGGCLIWKGKANADGYGTFTLTDAHGGKLEGAQVVRHTVCHRPLCISSDHLPAHRRRTYRTERSTERPIYEGTISHVQSCVRY